MERKKHSLRACAGREISSVQVSRKKARAFTRIELLSICAAMGGLALLMTPAFATTKSDSERMICFNNLRLIGRGVQAWAGDHNQQFSWRTPYADGGTFIPGGGARPGNAWFEYSWLSNELGTPKILACPSDNGVRIADDWRDYASAGGRAHNVSYSLNMDSSTDVPGSWSSGDRNLKADYFGGTCSSGVIPVTTIVTASSVLAWTNAVHGEVGHVLTTDGAVEFSSTARLREILLTLQDDNGAIHFLKAR